MFIDFPYMFRGKCVPIIKKKYRTYATPGISYSTQGVTGGTDQTSGECSLGQTIPI